jgi:hypothetical protein
MKTGEMVAYSSLTLNRVSDSFTSTCNLPAGIDLPGPKKVGGSVCQDVTLSSIVSYGSVG